MSKTPPVPRNSSAAAAKKVAAARKSGSNRTMLLIGGAALVIVVAVAVVGIVLANKENAPVGEAYGSSQSTAIIDGAGVITLSKGDAPKVIDVYEDPICPYCGAFEQKFGQQIAKAVDDGKLKVRYHMMNFLDASSASKDYSTRAAAALMCVAQKSGSEAGVYGKFHDLMFSSDVQPKEGSSSDHTTAELAQYATDSGAGAAAECITSGANLDLVRMAFVADEDTLTRIVGGVSSPVVLDDLTQVNTQNDNWLETLLAS